MDPLTISAAVGTATAAFNTIKQAFATGRELESMANDISRWMGAASDIDNAAKSAKNPSLVRKFMKGTSNIEQDAIQAFTAKKKLEEQRYELQQFIKFKYGTASWDELLRMEGQIRKQRQKEIYDRQKLKEKIITVVALIGVIIVGCGILLAFVYGLVQFDRGNW